MRLVGEHSMKSADPAGALRESAVMMVKVSRDHAAREDALAAAEAGGVGLSDFFLSEESALYHAGAGGGVGRGPRCMEDGVFVDESPCDCRGSSCARAALDVARFMAGAWRRGRGLAGRSGGWRRCRGRVRRRRSCWTEYERRVVRLVIGAGGAEKVIVAGGAGHVERCRGDSYC